MSGVVWFEKWVIKRRTIEDLASESGSSIRSLKRYFDDNLQFIKTSTFISLSFTTSQSAICLLMALILARNLPCFV